MKAPIRRRGSATRALRTAQAYRVGVTVETLRGHLVELEVVLRDLTLSGTASNEDLGGELVRIAVRLFKAALRLVRSCRLIAGGK